MCLSVVVILASNASVYILNTQDEDKTYLGRLSAHLVLCLSVKVLRRNNTRLNYIIIS